MPNLLPLIHTSMKHLHWSSGKSSRTNPTYAAKIFNQNLLPYFTEETPNKFEITHT